MMNEIKYLEFRNLQVVLPVATYKLRFENTEDRQILEKCEYYAKDNHIFMIDLNTMKTNYDVFEWNYNSYMQREAHKYIIEHFDELKSGDVIDISHIVKVLYQTGGI